MSDNPRLTAVRALTRVLDRGQTLDQVLPSGTAPLVRELVAGSLRHHFSLNHRIDELLTRPLRKKDIDVRALLTVGAYQILHTRIPDHAAVKETVDCTRALKKPWARGLVNAVLRNLPPATEEWPPDAHWDHPHWFINATRNSLPAHWSEVLRANNTRAPLSLRVNGSRGSRSEFRAELDQAGIEHRLEPVADALTLARPRPVAELPGHAAGRCSVQDVGAQLAAGWLPCRPGDRLLDACAAPGGKGFHCLERNPGVDLKMLEVADARVVHLREEAVRLGHERVDIQAADATRLDWWDGLEFDGILLDAPCSGSGTVRRHPDIKVLRARRDLEPLKALQASLLRNLWYTLRPGGHLLYCTCSLFHDENDAAIDDFVIGRSDANVVPLAPPEGLNGVAMTHGWQGLPTEDGMDGFYYSLLHKTHKRDAGSFTAD
ncbi:MAG: 16S rRNA (cytosine(967)-C(5))-methyltransferase RsmB [Pseudomonadota bacterium]